MSCSRADDKYRNHYMSIHVTFPFWHLEFSTKDTHSEKDTEHWAWIARKHFFFLPCCFRFPHIQLSILHYCRVDGKDEKIKRDVSSYKKQHIQLSCTAGPFCLSFDGWRVKINSKSIESTNCTSTPQLLWFQLYRWKKSEAHACCTNLGKTSRRYLSLENSLLKFYAIYCLPFLKCRQCILSFFLRYMNIDCVSLCWL